jgi:tetratricopeptide (TPR) repeat protein
MTKRSWPRPGAAPGTGRREAIQGHRERGRRQLVRWLHGSVYGYAVAGLALAALGLIWPLGVVGCGPAQTSGYIEATPGTSFSQARQSPMEVARHLRNAHYYKLMGRPDLALKELEDAHQQNPDNLKIVNTLAQGYEAQGQFDAARKVYQEALTRNGPNRALTNNLCFTYYQEGRWQEAETCFRETLARDPGNEAARNNLGLLYCRLGRQDEARQLWQEAEGSAAAAAKIHQALAALGLSDGAVYAQAPKSAPPVTATAPPIPVAAASPPAVSTVKSQTPAPTLAPPKVAMQSAPEPAPQSPAAAKVKALAKTAPPPAPAKTAAAPAPAQAQRAARHQRPPYLTCAELVGTGIEVRNGTPKPHLAREMRSLLSQEAFTVVGIGNYVDFGAKKTMVYYRPDAQRVAQALHADVLPMAGLEATDRLKGKAAIKVLLGHDLLENQELLARLQGKPQPEVAFEAPAPPEKLAAGPVEVKTPAAAPQAPEPLLQAKAEPPAPLRAQAPSSQPFKPLTAAELENTAIEIQNGNGSHDLAHHTRTLLGQDGFTVAKIGNYIDFGAPQTIIFYRPEGERVAQAISRTFFPKAELEPSLKLPHNIAVKILLGVDLLEQPQLMAHLAPEEQ